MADTKISNFPPIGVLEDVDIDLDIFAAAKDMAGSFQNRGYTARDILMAFQLLPDPFNQYRLKVDDSSNAVTALSINSGVVNIDLSLGDYFTLELTANVTSITFSNLPGSGRGFSKFIQITQTGAFTVDWAASFRWEGGSADAVSGSAAVDLLAITSVDNGATIHATLSKDRKVPA